MIEALFSQSNYVAAKRLLDLTATRQAAIASNLANIEMPNYKRLDVPAAFEAQLQQAVAEGDTTQLRSLKPVLAEDTTAIANRSDGNTVDLENEMTRMYQNSLEHTLETQLVTSHLLKMRLAITGRPV